MSKYSYTPTDKEAETIERAGLAAALKELQPLKNNELAITYKVLACLRAFKATNSAVIKAHEALKQKHLGIKYVDHCFEATDIVCSALAGLRFDYPDEISPNSILGSDISVLLQAAKALEAMSTVYSAFDSEDIIFGTYLAEETVMLSEAFHRTDRR